MGHIEGMDMVCASLAFIDGLGAPEMVLIFVVVLVLFGGQKLPEFARGLGKSIREFKKAAAGVEEEFKRALEEDERKNATPKLAAAPVETAAIADPTIDPYHYHDPAGPEAAVHSPVTDDHATTETVPSADDASSADHTVESPEHGDAPPDEHKILPPPPATSPTAATPPKPPPPPPATSYPENPS
jgi:TatA/E family protein of Tat protein translocase